ncbi:uncharacterized protein PHACADRAFT_109339, partial [Phanerochaete carnosa HHB-10118-sp]
TLRHHMESKHEGKYWNHIELKKLKSMLPKDREKERVALAAEKERNKQLQLDPHLKEMPKKERVIAYTHQVFRRAAIEWLVATGQPLSALEHESFKKMINIASQARDGVEILSRKVARQEIIAMFKEYMRNLKAKLNVSLHRLI